MKKLFSLIAIFFVLIFQASLAQSQELDIIQFEKLLNNSQGEIKATILSSIDTEYQIDTVDNTKAFLECILNHPNVFVDLTIKAKNGWKSVSDIGFLGNLTNLTLDGVNVNSISNCPNLKSITLLSGADLFRILDCPKLESCNGSIAYIENCPKIKSVEIKANVYSYLDLLKLDNFSNLENLILPEGIVNIQINNCPKLKTVKLPESVMDVDFFGCTGLEEITIPKNVFLINPLCFANCTNLKKISFQNPNVEISNSAFFACDNLLSKNNPKQVELMGKKFPSFSSLDEEITINANDTYSFLYDTFGELVDKETFGYSQNNLSFANVKKITIIASLEDDFAFKQNDERSIVKRIFGSCDNLETLELIGGKNWGAIVNLPNLKNLILGNGMKSISYIYNCPKLEKIILPNTLETLPRFDYCSSLKTIEIPSGITIIPQNCFYNCVSLENIKLPNSLKTIEAHAFEGCKNLSKIILPTNLDSIKEYAFAACKSLKEINLNDKIVVEKGAFWGCESLNKDNSPNTITICGRKFDYYSNNVGSDINNDVSKFFAMESFYGEPVNFESEYSNLKTVKLQKISENNPDYSIDFMMGENMDLGIAYAPNLEFAEINVNQHFPFCLNLGSSCNLKTIVLHGGLFLYEAPKYIPYILETQEGESKTLYTIFCSHPAISSKYEVKIYAEDKYLDFYQKQADLYNVLFAGNIDYDNNNKAFIRQKITILPLKDYLQTIENVEVPYGVTRIDDREFRNYTSLKNITLPTSIKTIGEYAFSNCSSLEKIIIPQSVDTICNFAFSSCKNLKDIQFSPNTFVDKGVFWECVSLKNNSNPKTIIVAGKEFDYSTDDVECTSSEIGYFYKYAKSLSITNTITYSEDGNNPPVNLFNRAELESLKIRLNGQESNSVSINFCPRLQTIEAILDPQNKAEIVCSESPNIQTLIFRGENRIHLVLESYVEYIKIRDLNGKKVKKKFVHEDFCYFPSQKDIKLYVENSCIPWYNEQAEIHNRLFAGKEYRGQICGKIEVFSIDNLK